MGTVSYAYTNNSLIDTVELPNGTTCRYGYDNANRPTSREHQYADASDTDFSATYYPDGSREPPIHFDYDKFDQRIGQAGDSRGATGDGLRAETDSCQDLAFLNNVTGFH